MESEERQRRFGAMVEYVDKLVRRVTAQLDALKLSQRTLVVFTGDKGTQSRAAAITASIRSIFSFIFFVVNTSLEIFPAISRYRAS